MRVQSHIRPIVPRQGRFGARGYFDAYWHGGCPVATAQYSSLSLAFPAGEQFFIDTVRLFVDELPTELAADARNFIAQEANHAREHLTFNRALPSTPELVESHQRTAQIMATARTYSPDIRIAFTAAMEHFTAILAHAILADPRHLEGMPDDLRRLWIWHALEEIEHKAVAFDILAWQIRTMPKGRAWVLRAKTMLIATRAFIRGRWRTARLFLAREGQDTRINRLRLLILLFGAPGLYRQCLLPWLAFFAPGFHPWKRDDSRLITRAKGDLQKSERRS